MPEFLPVPVAAERTGIPATELYRLITAGAIPGAYRGFLGIWTVPAEFRISATGTSPAAPERHRPPLAPRRR